MRRPWVRALLGALLLLAVLAIGTGWWIGGQLRASLPLLDGTRQLAGLAARVIVTRDALGIPTIRGASREDVARATGFLHAQDRYFQMDLSRRRAAGELAGLVGARALGLDSDVRKHRFRAIAQRAMSLLPQRDRGILEAYSAGVNSGLTTMAAPPFEYLALRQEPERWRPEDSLLVVLSMFLTLQDGEGAYEGTLATMRDLLPAEMFDFMVPAGTEWDAPVVGERFVVPAVPGPDVYNPRLTRAGKPPVRVPVPPADRAQLPSTSNSRLATSMRALLGVGHWEWGVEHESAVGSNNWVVSGALTATGAPFVANDMHLSVRVPNTWYRAALEWGDNRIAGVTLPGVPAVVVGSNTHVAWGFTNTYADWSDIVLLEIDRDNPARYRTPHGWREFEHYDEPVKVAGEEDRTERVTWTTWGPMLEPDHRGRPRALRWVAHAAERLASTVTPFEDARTVEEAFDAANGVGAPGQNFVVADRTGRIGWSIYGSIPRRGGFDSRLPSSWADGTRGWHGWLEPAEYPRLIDPPDGRIWTANARVVDGPMLSRLGDGSYEVGSRATVIRDRLAAGTRFTTRDMLDIQLDASATFLVRWRDLILRSLTPEVIDGHDERAALRELVERTWTGKASPDSAAYRLTRMFREQLSERVIGFVLASCFEADPDFDHTLLRRREGPIWKIVNERPMHLLDPAFASWDELIAAAVDTVIERTREIGGLSDPWSAYNVTRYRHPLSAALPLVGRWLDMPWQPVPGDLFTPRVQWGSIGASQRMVVSPGREHEGLMHMPTGQSGHPLSPFYGNSHQAWIRGDETPFLPGPAVHRLELTP